MKRTTTTKLHDGIKPTSEKIIVGRLNTTISAEINILCSEFVAIGYRHIHTPACTRNAPSHGVVGKCKKNCKCTNRILFGMKSFGKLIGRKFFDASYVDVGGNIFYECLRLSDNLLDNIIQSVGGVKFQKKFASRICLLYTQKSG